MSAKYGSSPEATQPPSSSNGIPRESGTKGQQPLPSPKPEPVTIPLYRKRRYEEFENDVEDKGSNRLPFPDPTRCSSKIWLCCERIERSNGHYIVCTLPKTIPATVSTPAREVQCGKKYRITVNPRTGKSNGTSGMRTHLDNDHAEAWDAIKSGSDDGNKTNGMMPAVTGEPHVVISKYLWQICGLRS